MSSETGVPMAPWVSQARMRSTAKDEAMGKLTAARALRLAATKAAAALTSEASGFSQKAARPAARAIPVSARWEAGGEAI